MVLMYDDEIFKSIEVLIGYFMPGLLLSLLIVPDLLNDLNLLNDLLNFGLFPIPLLSINLNINSLGIYIFLGIIMGALLRGCDSFFHDYILKKNLINLC